jgi:hypothetical protein
MHNDARHFAQTTSYAAKIVHANMHPRHIVGEWITFDTDQPLVIGNDVFVVFNDGTTITWQLDAISETELTVSGHNPPQTQTLHRSEIRELYPVGFWGIKDLSRFVGG